MLFKYPYNRTIQLRHIRGDILKIGFELVSYFYTEDVPSPSDYSFCCHDIQFGSLVPTSLG